MANELRALDKPTKWPGANARLLSPGVGLPVKPIDRLALFSADDFERFVLEWADDYLAKNVPDVTDVQQRGGSGDKGRDIVVWFGQPGSPDRYWHLYQCKRYSTALGQGKAVAEIGKVLYFVWRGDFSLPKGYWFVTRKGVTNDLQDLIDHNKLGTYLIENWDEHCAGSIVSKKKIELEGDFLKFVRAIDFSLIRVKQPLEILSEHAQTKYHKFVFGAPLVDRPKPTLPPSVIDAKEQGYVRQLYDVIGELTGTDVQKESDFEGHKKSSLLFKRSRASFYSAEGLKELARDQMDDVKYFDDLLERFETGLYYTFSGPTPNGYERLSATVKAAQLQQIDGHVLRDHMSPLDREGVCHHLANSGAVTWCDDE
ncbi:ABC-three component system protein [Ensifer sp. 4252]|uniref:ABC-three component system protein n=1 Tax=Ensifer sp. 4252 TaxID=3373915 RepID=UPI003D1CF5BC